MCNYYFSTHIVDFLFLSKIMFQKWKYKFAYNYHVYVLLEYKSLKKGGQEIWSRGSQDLLIDCFIYHTFRYALISIALILRTVLRDREHYFYDTVLKVKFSEDRSILVRVIVVKWWRKNSNPSLCDYKSQVFLTCWLWSLEHHIKM